MRKISQIIKNSNVLQYAIDNGMEYEDVRKTAKITLDREDYSCIECGFNHDEANLLIILKNPELFNPNSDELTADKLTVVCESDMMENNVDTNKSNDSSVNEFESNEELHTINAEDEDIEIFIDEQDKSNEDVDSEFVVSSEDMKDGNFSTLNDIDFEEDERTDDNDYNEFEDESGFDDEIDIGVPDEDKDEQVSNNDNINNEFEDNEFEDNEFEDESGFDDEIDIGVPEEDKPSKNNNTTDKDKLNNNTSNNDKIDNDSKTKKIDNFEPKESFISSFFYNFTLSENIWNLLIFMLLFGGIIATSSYTIGMDSSEPYVTMITEISSVFILLGTILFTFVWLSSRYDTFEPKEYANKYIYYSVFSSLIAICIIVLHIIVLLNQTYSVMFAIPAIPFIIFSAYSANLVIRTDKTKLLEKELLYKSEKYDGEIDERLKNLVTDLRYPKSLQFNSLLWVTTINSLTYATILTLFTGPSENIINLILLSLILISVPSIIFIYMLVYRFTLFGEYK